MKVATKYSRRGGNFFVELQKHSPQHIATYSTPRFIFITQFCINICLRYMHRLLIYLRISQMKHECGNISPQKNSNFPQRTIALSSLFWASQIWVHNYILNKSMSAAGRHILSNDPSAKTFWNTQSYDHQQLIYNEVLDPSDCPLNHPYRTRSVCKLYGHVLHAKGMFEYETYGRSLNIDKAELVKYNADSVNPPNLGG